MNHRTTTNLQPHTVILPDTRRLAWAEYGDRSGHPTLFFHGFPGSRLQAAPADAPAASAQVRLIAIDRPGFGGSDRRPGRRLLDWPADVLRLVDHLGLERFTIVGVSGGGPYAAVCAYAMPQRLDAVGIVSGLAPLDSAAALDGMLWINRLILRAARRAPGLVRALLRPAVVLRGAPRSAMRVLAAGLDAPDRAVFARREVLDAVAASLRESLVQGTAGHADELLVIAQPWGFALEDIRVPVRLWHGGQDPIVPPSHFDAYCKRVPQAACELMPSEGHFSLVIDHAAEIFAVLEASRPVRPGND